jgi:ribosomal protein S12 methylthiotransferase accessory factor
VEKDLAKKGAFLRAAECAGERIAAAGTQIEREAGWQENLAPAQAFLTSCGLLVPDAGGFRPAAGVPLETLCRFAAFLDRFAPRLAFAPLQGCPFHVCTALPGKLPDDDGLVAAQPVLARLACGGQGLERHQAVFGCLGEMAERLSLVSRGQDDALVRRAGVAGEEDLDAGAFLQFSRQQEEDLAARFPPLAAVWDGQAIAWNRLSDRRMQVICSLTGKAAAIPPLAVLLGEGAHLGLPQVPLGSTLGAAVWTDRETAARRAILELAERDAAGIWWYNRLGITPLPEAQVAAFLPTICAKWLSARNRATRFFYLPVDFSLHVIAAISHDADGKSGVIGVAGGLEPSAVLLSAIGELVQGEFALELAALQRAGPGAGRPHVLDYAARDIRADLRLGAELPHPVPAFERTYSWQDFETSLQAKGVRIWLADCTRPETGFACVKALSADLCSWLPRFGNRRLFTAPVARGLRSGPADEGSFSGRRYPF